MAKANFSSMQSVSPEDRIRISTILKGVFLSYIITMVIFLIFATVITYTDFPESTIPAIVVVATIFSIVIGGAGVAKKAKSKGWLNGALTGATYIIILYFISALSLVGFVFDKNVIYMLILGIISGAFGGILGINLKKKFYKR
jgi:putative membrane protein (TIGR04086 family)